MSQEQEGEPPPPPTQGMAMTAVVADPAGQPEPALNQHLLPPRAEQPIADWKEVGLVVVAGFFGNIALRTSVATASATLAFVVLVMALSVGGRPFQKGPRALVALALALMPWLVIRSNVALTVVTVSMIAILLAVATGLSLRGSVFDSRAREFASHVVAMLYEWGYGADMVKRLVVQSTAERKAVPLLRGLAVTVPVLIVFTTLLASADDVFARFLLLGSLPSLFGHLLVTAAVAFGFFMFVSRYAHLTPPTNDPTRLRFLGAVEVTMILGGLVLLFGGFVVTQVVVAVDGASHVLEAEGLTQAQHARRGFFQLLWVAGLAVSLVGALRATRIEESERPRDRFTPLALTTLVLTLTIAAISIQRLSLYVGSYGLTPLRVWALAGAGAIGIVIATYAASIAGYRSDRRWFPGAVLVGAFVLVTAMNVANPDRIVADYNISNQRIDEGVDLGTLYRLSDDAVPAIVDRLAELSDSDRAELESQMCARVDRKTSYGVLEYNRSKVAADSALDARCDLRSTSSTRLD